MPYLQREQEKIFAACLFNPQLRVSPSQRNTEGNFLITQAQFEKFVEDGG